MAGRVFSCICLLITGALAALLAPELPCRAQEARDGTQVLPPEEAVEDGGQPQEPPDGAQGESPAVSRADKSIDVEEFIERMRRQAADPRADESLSPGERRPTLEDAMNSQVRFRLWEERRRAEQEAQNRLSQQRSRLQRQYSFFTALYVAAIATLFVYMRRYKKRAQSAEAQARCAEAEIDLLRAQIRVLEDRAGTDSRPPDSQ